MKKVVIAIVAIVFIALTLTSCRSTSRCPAYGESHKFQKERGF